MFCNKCGTPLPEGATHCPRCGVIATPRNGAPQEEIPTHLLRSILVTIFCCLPLGIVGIVYASKVSSLMTSGRIDEAKAASESAGKWSLWGLILGLVSGILWFLIQVAASMAAMA